MRYAEIEDGVVINVALADPEVADERGWVPADDTVGIGWTYDGEEFAPPPSPALPVPEAVQMAQARLALLGAGKLSAVDAALNALPSPQREAAKIEWKYRANVRRDSPLVLALGPALGLTDGDIDNLFIQASTL